MGRASRRNQHQHARKHHNYRTHKLRNRTIRIRVRINSCEYQIAEEGAKNKIPRVKLY